MGAHQSVITSMEPRRAIDSIMDDDNDDQVPPPEFTSNTPTTTSIPPSPPPKMVRIETFEEKLYRKFKSEPLVPIGCLVTAYFLGSGIRSFYQRDAMRSQRMMRARVGAQFATLMIFIGYYGMSEFNLKFAPGMAPSKKDGEPK